jgi:hypothetical protein
VSSLENLFLNGGGRHAIDVEKINNYANNEAYHYGTVFSLPLLLLSSTEIFSSAPNFQNVFPSLHFKHQGSQRHKTTGKTIILCIYVSSFSRVDLKKRES